MSKARTIYKFDAPLAGRFLLDMPRGRVIAFQEQHGRMQVWAEVQIGWPGGLRAFEVFGTGHQIPDDVEHRGTAQQGPFVWHLYEYV